MVAGRCHRHRCAIIFLHISIKEYIDIRIKHLFAILISLFIVTAVGTDVSAANQPKPKEYIVVEGDYLELIAQKNGITWPKIYAKNLDIANPDQIDVGQKLIIPTVEEVVADRPVPVAPVVTESQVSYQAPSQTSSVSPFRGSGGPNGYEYGYCTWYVKTMRPDIGGYWGDASAWPSSARAAGYSTGTVPAVGAIAVSYESSWGHVAYVTGVNGNSVTVSEMNVQGWGVISTRTTSAGFWHTYIY